MTCASLLQENNYFFDIKDVTDIDIFSIIIKIFVIMLICFFLGIVCYEFTINKILIVLGYMQIIKIVYAYIWNFKIFGFIDVIIDNINVLNDVLHLIVFFISDICFIAGIFITKYILLKNMKNSIIYIFLKNIIFYYILSLIPCVATVMGYLLPTKDHTVTNIYDGKGNIVL